MAAFKQALKADLVRVLEPLEDRIKPELHRIADEMKSRGSTEERAIGEVLNRACEVMEALET